MTMPKFRFYIQPKHYNTTVSKKNCDDLLYKIQLLVYDYFNLLSLNDKKQLLYIARMIEKNHQALPENKRYGYNKRINDMLNHYKEIIK